MPSCSSIHRRAARLSTEAHDRGVHRVVAVPGSRPTVSVTPLAKLSPYTRSRLHERGHPQPDADPPVHASDHVGATPRTVNYATSLRDCTVNCAPPASPTPTSQTLSTTRNPSSRRQTLDSTLDNVGTLKLSVPAFEFGDPLERARPRRRVPPRLDRHPCRPLPKLLWILPLCRRAPILPGDERLQRIQGGSLVRLPIHLRAGTGSTQLAA